MKRTQLLTIILSAAILSIAFDSCQKEKAGTSIPDVVSVKEAKAIYREAENEVTTRFKDRFLLILPDWDHVQTESRELNHSVMYLPLGYDDSTGNYLYMMVMKDEGILRSLLVGIQPDKNWREQHTSLDDYKKVTGKLVFYSVNGRFFKGFLMQEGVSAGEYTPEEELGNITSLMGLRSGTVSARNEDLCVYGTFGCKELAGITITGSGNRGDTDGYSRTGESVYITTPKGYNNGTTASGYDYNWYKGGGGGASINYLVANLINKIGNKPVKEYSNKCAGLEEMWKNYPRNEVFGYITLDNQLLVTDVLRIGGGNASGAYKHTDGTGKVTYYFTYPDTQGPPSGSYSGLIHTGGKYFIPIKASVHTHTPCRSDGTNGVSHDVGDDDKIFATKAPGLKHWVIGCNAIGEFNNKTQSFFNIQTGNISVTCSKIQ